MMTLVWELELPDSEKLVLLALADCANDEGHCWPGMKTLADKCSKSDRTVQLSIQMLCAKGHLTRREVAGKGCNYTVHPIIRLASDPRSDDTPEAASPRSERTAPPKPVRDTPEAASGKPSKNHKEPSSERRVQGSRLPDNWQPSADDIAFAKGLGHTDEQITSVAEIFRDYWMSQPGQRGVKTDWPATWRNWMRREGKAKPQGYVSKSGYEYRGDLDAVQREAQRRGDNDTYWQVEADRKRRAVPIGNVVQAIVNRAA